MEKYNPEKSLPTTFFNLYIIHEMSKYIDTEVNKTTSHYSSNLTKINRVIDKFEAQSKKWTPTDIAVETGLNMETIIQCLHIKEYKNEMYYETYEILEANISERSPSPEQAYIENERMEILYNSISTLLPEEIQVLQYRYGLNGSKTISYKEIAKEMGISIEKVRKYRHDAIRKLRHKANMRNIFKDYVADSEKNSITENDISLIPEAAAEIMMSDLEEIDFNFDDE
jgi:RNA polymerase sigma factor (sigma-70 family)